MSLNTEDGQNFLRFCCLLQDHVRKNLIRNVGKEKLTWDEYRKLVTNSPIKKDQFTEDVSEWDITLLTSYLKKFNFDERCGEKWLAVDNIRKIRNDSYAHRKTATMPTKEFSKVVKDFEEIYATMEWNTEEIEEVKEKNCNDINAARRCIEEFLCVAKSELQDCVKEAEQLLHQVKVLAEGLKELRVQVDGSEDRRVQSQEHSDLKKSKILELFGSTFSASKFKELGTYLDVPAAKIKAFRHNNMGDAEDTLIDVLDYWLETDKDKSWSKLAQAVQNCGYNILADDIRKNRK